MILSDTTVRAIKPESKTYALSDGNGLLLEVLPSGSMVWRYKFHFDGKRPRLTIGRYPQISLATARSKRDEASKLLAEGINPAAKKQDDKRKRKIELSKATTFEKLSHPNGYILGGISSRSKLFGHTTLNNLIDRLEVAGARFVPHGCRATASTLLIRQRSKFLKNGWKRWGHSLRLKDLADEFDMASPTPTVLRVTKPVVY